MKAVGQKLDTVRNGGNSNKRIRIIFQGNPAHDTLIKALNVKVALKNAKALKKLPAEELRKVTAEHIWNAIEKLVAGTTHSFDASTKYDVLLEDGARLPPKAVFGVAATEALGRDVLPENFSAGQGQSCFRILKECGYNIVPKESVTGVEPPSQQDRDWAEGKQRAVAHLKRERAAGLSFAKKAQFKREHDGLLYCERCKMNPVERYGIRAGEACIEVHHSNTQVKDMEGEHRTKLNDLECLCANCHRVVHRELKLADLA